MADLFWSGSVVLGSILIDRLNRVHFSHDVAAEIAFHNNDNTRVKSRKHPKIAAYSDCPKCMQLPIYIATHVCRSQTYLGL